MPSRDAEALAQQAARRVREAIEAAEKRAEEIVALADQEAAGIRARAEAEARERIDRAQEAVDRLVRQAGELRDAVNALGREVAADDTNAETPAPEIDPTPTTVPEPEPAREPEATPPLTPEPASPGEPEPQPPEVPEAAPGGDRVSTEELIERVKGGGAQPDEGAARLVAMKMALDGKPREEVERRLAESYELAEPGALLDDVYSRVGK